MPRKPIQIAAVPVTHLDNPDASPTTRTEVFALCDDGSIWSLSDNESRWTCLPPMPQQPTMRDWMNAVTTYLRDRHNIKGEDAQGLMEKNRDTLETAYSSETNAQEAARVIALTRMHGPLP